MCVFFYYYLCVLHFLLISVFLCLSFLFPIIPFLSTANSISDAAQMGNDVRQKAVQSSWAKKYVVVEIPPYCRRRGGKEDREVDGRTEGYEEDVFGESWSPMVPSSERDSGEAMDCSGRLEEEEEGRGGTDSCPM